MQMFWKLLCALVLLLVLGVFSGVDARVEPPQGETNPNVAAAQHDEGKGLEKFLVSFSNNANDEHFKKTEEWIIQNNLEITETVNESYIKFLVAKMSKADVQLLEEKKAEWEIETIEHDDFDSMEKSEL